MRNAIAHQGFGLRTQIPTVKKGCSVKISETPTPHGFPFEEKYRGKAFRKRARGERFLVWNEDCHRLEWVAVDVMERKYGVDAAMKEASRSAGEFSIENEHTSTSVSWKYLSLLRDVCSDDGIFA